MHIFYQKCTMILCWRVYRHTQQHASKCVITLSMATQLYNNMCVCCHILYHIPYIRTVFCIRLYPYTLQGHTGSLYHRYSVHEYGPQGTMIQYMLYSVSKCILTLCWATQAASMTGNKRWLAKSLNEMRSE